MQSHVIGCYLRGIRNAFRRSTPARRQNLRQGSFSRWLFDAAVVEVLEDRTMLSVAPTLLKDINEPTHKLIRQ